MTDQKPPLTMRDADPATFQTSAAAPATILDAARAPGTIRDAAGAPGTIRDAAGAPGTTHDSGSAPGTTRDQGTPGPRTADSRFIRPLPPTLQARYEVQRDLGGGGEADLVLVSDRETAEQCVVRLYRRQDLPLDENKLDRLRTADRKHLIGLLDYGRGDGYVWEILEYAPEGSLEEMIKSYRAPWPAAQVLDIFDQLAPAITYANSLGMVHRDIKPGNILIRSLHPLDLVLADFGLAKILAATQHHGTTSMTAAYAPPEAISGHASLSVDWWSLGIILLELLNGLHPFQIPDDKRSWQNEQVITTFLITKDIDLSEVTDERWRLLLRGLLTRAPDKRWVRSRLLCGAPGVHLRSPSRTRPGPPRRTSSAESATTTPSSWLPHCDKTGAKAAGCWPADRSRRRSTWP